MDTGKIYISLIRSFAFGRKWLDGLRFLDAGIFLLLPVASCITFLCAQYQFREIKNRILASDRVMTGVAILTSSRAGLDITENYNLGANSYIKKPVGFLQFAEDIKNLGLYWIILNEPPTEVAQ